MELEEPRTNHFGDVSKQKIFNLIYPKTQPIIHKNINFLNQFL